MKRGWAFLQSGQRVQHGLRRAQRHAPQFSLIVLGGLWDGLEQRIGLVVRYQRSGQLEQGATRVWYLVGLAVEVLVGVVGGVGG